jgi:hypothetical protein
MHLLKPHYKDIVASKNPQVNLVYRIYEIIFDFLLKILDLDNFATPSNKLALIGGIMINCEGEKTDMFLPLHFDVRTKESRTDLFSQAFGPKGDESLIKNQ